MIGTDTVRLGVRRDIVSALGKRRSEFSETDSEFSAIVRIHDPATSISTHRPRPARAIPYCRHSGGKLDLLWVRGRPRWGFEFKRTSSPTLTRSLMTGLETLELQKAFLVHAGDKTFPLHQRVTAVSAARLLSDIAQP